MTNLLKTITCILLSTVFHLTTTAQNNNSIVVQTKVKNGTLEGLYDVQTGLQYYLGIPFAKPPVGELRWKAPQPVASWTGVRQAKAFGPRPVQGVIWGDMKSRSNGVSEDCLYLNVWSPAKRNTQGLPVLVYFFGGGFIGGDGSEPRYDGASMAQKGIVVVTINYRLGIFGFFAHPELSAESPNKASGNYGLLDQNAALRWVQQNITAFGGDPKKVTIAGESAGSLSVSAQMASPLSKNLFRGAIGESGAAIYPTLAPVTKSEAEKTGLDFAKKSGNLTLKQLRAMSTREIWELYSEARGTRFPLVIDGYFFPKNVEEVFNAKEQTQAALLLGWNTGESSGTGFMQGLPYTTENFIKKVTETYPIHSAEILKLYPHANPTEVEYAATALASDRFIGYCTWKWFDLHRKNSNQPVYRYLFSRIRPAMVDPDMVAGGAGGVMKKDENAPQVKLVGAPHASEIEYCMGNLPLINDFAWTKDDYQVSKTMQDYFANFIKTGNPNGTGLAEWQPASPNDQTPPVMVIDVESKQKAAENDNRYLLLDKVFHNK